MYITHSIPCCRKCVYFYRDMDIQACIREEVPSKFIGKSSKKCDHYKEKAKESKPQRLFRPGGCWECVYFDGEEYAKCNFGDKAIELKETTTAPCPDFEERKNTW